MNRFVLKAAVVSFFAGMTLTVSAANPFSDVDTDSWAYQAISSLSDQNIVEGYPDGTFRGNKHLTRYELAQVVARLMAKSDRLSAEQQAVVGKLAGEYKDELTDLGVRVAALEEKTGRTSLLTELRVHGVNRYDNVFKDKKESHFETGARVRLNTLTRVNDRSYLYGQLQTHISMNGNELYDVNKWNYNPDGSTSVRGGHEDGGVHLNRLFATYQFGKKQNTENLPFGPTKNLIGIGQFPVKMGVTGYTYDGEFKGAFLQFGDYVKGGHLTLAYGRATNINYDYTGPMMHGVSGDSLKVPAEAKQKLIAELRNNQEIQKILSEKPELANLFLKTDTTLKDLNDGLQGIGQVNPDLAKAFNEKVNRLFGTMYYDAHSNILYPMGKDVMMDWGDDEDVPAVYASYIYKIPEKLEFHAYGLKAVGPVGHITKAYGFAGSYDITPQWNLHGEFVKNLCKLPLNNERPYSYNYGVSYGHASVLKPKSYSFGLDYVYSQAGTYFGGSGNDIADQYMGHIYQNWNGLGKMPAYFADKMDALTDGDKSNDHVKFGGAKFFLAKAQYVPMKGLIIEANYGFNATDMGGKKMDNILLLKATAYIK
ncbi:MAG: S-layer homology domain-containing protein [Dialister sp.]|nr:S-layer homology domain-containing protein [Dialister sp.]